MFPNPAEDMLTISLANISPVRSKGKILDIVGRIRGEFYINDKNESNVSISVQNLVPGLYYLYIESAGKIYQAKFIRK